MKNSECRETGNSSLVRQHSVSMGSYVCTFTLLIYRQTVFTVAGCGRNPVQNCFKNGIMERAIKACIICNEFYKYNFARAHCVLIMFKI